MQQLAQVNAKLVAESIPYGLIRAAIASSSLPVICRSTTMRDGRTYVDGGIRSLAPIQAANDAGASNVYAIAAGSTPGLFPDNPWPVPVVVIQPDPTLDDIHDGLTIEAGLMDIIKLRKQIWDLEFPANGKEFVPRRAACRPRPIRSRTFPPGIRMRMIRSKR